MASSRRAVGNSPGPKVEPQVSPGGENTKHRVQFDFTAAAYEKLVKLKDRQGASSYADVVRNALQIYEWILNQRDDGWTFRLARNDEEKEVQLVI